MHPHTQPEERLYGIIGEFSSPEALLSATERVYGQGYRKMDAFSPMPVHGLAEAMGVHKTGVAGIVLIGALCGMTFGFVLQWWMGSLSYLMNIGGRPPLSWPAYIPITFECTILFSAFSAVIGMFTLNGLPRPNHPVFNHPRFDTASIDGFFLAVEASDPLYDTAKTGDLLQQLEAVDVRVLHE